MKSASRRLRKVIFEHCDPTPNHEVDIPDDDNELPKANAYWKTHHAKIAGYYYVFEDGHTDPYVFTAGFDPTKTIQENNLARANRQKPAKR